MPAQATADKVAMALIALNLVDTEEFDPDIKDDWSTDDATEPQSHFDGPSDHMAEHFELVILLNDPVNEDLQPETNRERACQYLETPLSSDQIEKTSLPMTKANRAVQYLNPKQFVSATAIELVLQTVCPAQNEHFRILDPGWIALNDQTSIGKKLRLRPIVRHILVPLHSNYHWALAHVSLSNQRIFYYDSW